MAEAKGLRKVTIHTDGGCDGNPGPGGWAAVLRFGEHVRELTGGDPATTNNRMELQAAISALTALKEPCDVTIFTDSEYLRTAEKKAVKNDDLWRQLDEVASKHKVNWQWLRGHAGHPDNERCDQLAGVEIQKLRRQYTPEKLSSLREAFIASRDPQRNQRSLF